MFQPSAPAATTGQLVRDEQYVPPQFLPTPNSPFIYNPIVSSAPIPPDMNPLALQKATGRPGSSSSHDSGVEDSYVIHQIDAENGDHVLKSTKENESDQSSGPRKRGRPRKNPTEPRKKRGAIEYDPMGDSCTRILLEYKRNLELRALGLHPPNPFLHPPPSKAIPTAAAPVRRKQVKPNAIYTTDIEQFHNFDSNSNVT